MHTESIYGLLVRLLKGLIIPRAIKESKAYILCYKEVGHGITDIALNRIGN